MNTKNLKIVLLFLIISVLCYNALIYLNEFESNPQIHSFILSVWNVVTLIFLPIYIVCLIRDGIVAYSNIKKQEKQMEMMNYQVQTYKSLQDAKYELEKNSHRIMRIASLLESESFQNPQLIEEIRKIKVNLKEEGYYINTGNIIFDYLITNKIKATYSLDTFKSMIAISEKEKYDRKEFISIIESLIDLYANCNGVEMNLFEKNDFLICDMCHSGDNHPDYAKWQTRHSRCECEIVKDDANRQHFKVIIE